MVPKSGDEKTDPAIALPPKAAPAAAPAPAAPQVRVQIQVKMPEMGLLEPLMNDPEITEIMVNDLRGILVERQGKIAVAGFRYESIDELNRLTRNILDVTGRILSPDQPYVDTMLPDGSRVNIVAPPLTQYGPCLTIRKFPSRRWKLDELAGFGMLDERMGQFLKACVYGRMNLLISGGTGSGKTTLLNALAGKIPKGERVVTIEDVPELAIAHFNSVKLQTKPQTPASAPVTARELTANALRMRPDRIIIGECRRGEAFDMLQAMNSGHEGSMTTLHANSPRDALTKTENLCMLAGTDLPLSAIRRQIASAIDLIVQVKRFRTSERRVVAVTEVTGMEGETITLQDIFLFQTRASDATEGAGAFVCTGFVPTFLDRLRENGVDLPRGFFA